MEAVLRGETLRLSWKIDNEGRTVADGVITGVDLKETVVTRDISWRLGTRLVPLKAGGKCRLAVQIEDPSDALRPYDPAMIIRTHTSLKGNPFAGWKTGDTLLLLLLGLTLVVLGLGKSQLEARGPA